jgi:hypothetical protein
VPSSVRSSSPRCARRTTIREHHVVRHVDDVRDRAHLGEVKARPEPLRRRSDRDVPEDAADVARTPCGILDPDVHRLVTHGLRVLDLGEAEVTVEKRGDLPGEPDHREQVDAVDRRRDVEYAVSDRQHVGERRARLDTVREHHDPRVILSEPDLVLGQDHPSRLLAAQLALVERFRRDREERAW